MSYTAESPEHISFRKGDMLTVHKLEDEVEGYSLVATSGGSGLAPEACLQMRFVSEPPTAAQTRDAQRGAGAVSALRGPIAVVAPPQPPSAEARHDAMKTGAAKRAVRQQAEAEAETCGEQIMERNDSANAQQRAAAAAVGQLSPELKQGWLQKEKEMQAECRWVGLGSSSAHEVQTSAILVTEAPAAAVAAPESARSPKLVAPPPAASKSGSAAAGAADDGLLINSLRGGAKKPSSALFLAPQSTEAQLPAEIHRILTTFDDPLLEVLESGDIRLLRTEWLLAQPDDYLLQNRQELEALEAAGVSPSPLLSPEEAVTLVRKGTRSAGTASHGWLTAQHPDPKGARVKLLRRELRERPYLEAIFFDYSSLYQGKRDEKQQAAFSRALLVMGDLYASAIGMTVLQIKEIPERPSEYNGGLALFKLKVTDESSIKQAFEVYGEVVRCEVGCLPEAIVRFSTHEAALNALRSAHLLDHICGGIDTLYNERSYDGRRGEAGRKDDEGRGWCSMESASSGELLMRLKAYPKMHEALDTLPPKLLLLSSSEPTAKVDLKEESLEGRVDRVVSRIESAHFIGGNDLPKVLKSYRDYVGRMGTMLMQTLPLLQSSFGVVYAEPTQPLALQPLLAVNAAGQVLLLAADQLLLVLPEGDSSRIAGGEGGTRFGVIDEAGRVSFTLAGGDAELSYDACVQAVLPWSPTTASGWDEALVRDVRALPELSERASRLSHDAQALRAESIDMAQLEKVRKEADSIAKAMAENRLLVDLSTTAAQAIAKAMAENRLLVDLSTTAAQAIRFSIDAATASHRPAPLFPGGEQKSPAEAKPSTSRQDPLLALQAAVARLQFEPESIAAAALRASGMLGRRHYAAGQWLSVQFQGAWRDAEVLAAGSEHRLRIEEKGAASLALHPWNHAPRELPLAAFEALREWWGQSLRAQHAQIADALTGKRLDALQQCVAIEVTGDAGLSGVHDVRGLSNWLHSLHSARSGGKAISAPGAALLTAPPAAGKTTLISQAVVLALERAELIPIVIKVQLLEARLREAPDAFASSWNWVDAYLRIVHTETSQVYRMLRQAMMARRALLLIDGLDEAAAKRSEIERHVAEVLAPQGHVMLCTSRPACVDEARFTSFRRLKLSPLTEAQQREALTQRLGEAGVEKLMLFVERMPLDAETEQRVIANPLMLSMVASVFEIRTGVDMPETVAELYKSASKAMLERGGVVSAEMRTLMEAILFEAHAAQARVITEVQLSRAALAVFAPPGTVAQLESQFPTPFEKFEGRAEKGHYVEMLKEGKWKGQRGIICKDDKSSNPYKVKLADGTETGWLCSKDLVSSGMDEAACLAQMAKESFPALQRAVDALTSEAREAVGAVRERVKQDTLPLLSLLQVEPLQMQSSHLSFQEYFAARAICSGAYRLPKGSPPPWRWTAFWANAVKLGGEMGDAFGKGLVQAAGVDAALDLKGQLGGDRPTSLAAVAQLMRGGLTSLDLSDNKLSGAEGVLIVEPLKASLTLQQLNVSGNELGDAHLIKDNAVLTSLNLSSNNLGDESGKAIARVLKASATLQQLDLSRNKLGSVSGNALSAELATNKTLKSLKVMKNKLSPVVVKALLSSGVKNDLEALSGCTKCKGRDCTDYDEEHVEGEQTNWNSCEDDEDWKVCHACGDMFDYKRTEPWQDGKCFTSSSLIRLADGTSRRIDQLVQGNHVWTPEGTALVVCVVHKVEAAATIQLFAMPDSSLRLSAGHLVHLNGAWQVVGAVGTPVECVDEVYNLVLDRGHVVEADGLWAATLLHDVDDERGRDFMQVLQHTSGWASGWVEMKDLRVAQSKLIWQADAQRGDARRSDRHPHNAAAHAEQAHLTAASSCPLDTTFVVELHRTAMAGSGLQSTFRSGSRKAIIGGSPHYVCPAASELPRLLDAFCAALASACEAWAPFRSAALALWSLCYLHLFSDGNGRAARGLAYAVLIRTATARPSAEQLHRFHAFFRERAVRRRYFETLQSTTDSLSGVHEASMFPESAFAPLAVLVEKALTAASATEASDNEVATAAAG